MKQLEDEIANEQLYDKLREAKYDIREAYLAYDEIMQRLFARGVGNVKIANELGVTEAAIRNYRKRMTERGITRR